MSSCFGYLRRGMGTAVDGVHDSGVVLLSGDSGVPLPPAPSFGTEICGSDCACSAALQQNSPIVSKSSACRALIAVGNILALRKEGQSPQSRNTHVEHQMQHHWWGST